MSLLPQEIIIEEILKRLPVESLVKFRVVCKLWNSLLHDTCFTRSHFKQSISKNPDNDYLIINDRKYVGGTCTNVLSILSRNNLSETCIDKLPYVASKSSSNNNINLIGSINGLVCLACFSGYRCRFMLWNPAIHRAKKILVPKHYAPALKDSVCGFGWDYMTNDYKLMIKLEDSAEVAVYSCESKSWSYKPVDCDVFRHVFRNYSDIFQFPSVVVKGIPYWECYDFTKIVKFEVRTNRFTSFSNGPYYTLVNIFDSLARIRYSDYIDVYLYDEERGVWSQMYEIKNVITRSIMTPMCFKYGGEIVYADKEKVNCYDPKSDEIKVLLHRKNVHTKGFSYTPSLLSLDGMSSTSLWI